MRAAVARCPPGVVRDGEVTDVDALAGALRDLFAEHKFSRQIRLGVANQKIVMRTLDLPPMTDSKQIASAVRFQAQDHIPMPLEQAVLEHHLVGAVETADGPRTRVVLVAARRDMIELLLDVTRRAGLRAQGIDLSAFAMIRALHRPGRTEPTLYVSVGGMTNLAVASSTSCFFTRVVPTGTEVMASELAERRGLTLEHARGWLRHVGLLVPIDDLDGDQEIVAEARSVSATGSGGSPTKSATRSTSTALRKARSTWSAPCSPGRRLRSPDSPSSSVRPSAFRWKSESRPRAQPAATGWRILATLPSRQA